MFANKSEVYIYRSLIKGNVTGGSSSDGGGISNTTSIMTIVNSTLSENEVGFGGGSAGGAIHNFGGVLPGQTSYLVVLNSTLNNNRGRGSAISNDSNASSLVVNTTISGNTGTPVYVETGTHEFINTTITQNSQQSGNNRAAGIRHRDTKGGTVTLRNTIVSDNINASGNAWGSNLEGAFIGDGNNLIGDLLGATGTIGTGTDIIAANPQLGPLQDNGGPTRTHAPLPDSPAIDGGNDAFLPNDILDLDGDGNTAEKLPLDQRGLDFNRVAGLRVDIGAVETQTAIATKPEFLGTPGADILKGTKGADILIGLGGNDTYFVNNPGDEVLENANEGTDIVRTSISYTLPNNVENLILNGKENINGTGNTLKNRMVGNGGNNMLNGGAGADILTGKTGADIFVFRFEESQLGAVDRITDFTIGVDKIDLITQGGVALSPVALTRAADTTTRNIATIVNDVFADSNGSQTGSQTLGLNSAALVQAGTATYLMINDDTAGFQSASDLVINLTGLTGAFPALGTIHVNTLFV